MNILAKYGSVLSCVFLLAACETPGSEDAAMDGGAGGQTVNGVDSNLVNDFAENVGDRVFFALDSSSLNSEGQATLERQATWLNQHADINVVVEGHADERGTREYNLALGERRANAAKNVLVAAGVNASRITVISYGKERPAVLGADEGAWAQNRRAVTVLAR
jgi:peptidoglycan-associated lipoprotein